MMIHLLKIFLRHI